MTPIDDARSLLGRAAVLRDPCDLDLLLFFARHPHSLLSTEWIARLLGYDEKAISNSIESLLSAGLVMRSPSTAKTTRLYGLTGEESAQEWLSSLVQFASTRRGRLTLMQALAPDPALIHPPAIVNEHRHAGPSPGSTRDAPVASVEEAREVVPVHRLTRLGNE